ncbi:MAG: hypothetical protein IJ318_03840 [Clostridia bacterium]|nr:hypothetical protein [Clostridia bacterium]
MKKSLKRTAAVVLAVATTAGVASTSAATLNNVYGDNNVKSVVHADSTENYKNTLQIANSNQYKKTVKLNETFEVPAAKVIDATGAEQDATFEVTTPSGDKITSSSFKVTEIGAYTITYTYGNYVGELTFVSEMTTYSVELLSNNANLLPSKVAVEDADGNAFKGSFNVPEYKVVDEDGDVVDAIVDITLQTPSYATSDISTSKVVDFNTIDIEEGYYIITYTAYKNNSGVKGDYLAETKTEFNAVSATSYENEHELTLVYSSEKPNSVNVGKTVELPAITAKAGNEAVPVYYTVEVYKNGSTTPIASTAKVNNTDTLIITKNEDGVYEFTADEVGVYYRVVYTVRDAFGELNQKQTEFNIETVEDTLDPTPIVVDAYDAADADALKALKNKDYALKTTFGAEPVIIKAIYAEDLGTFDYADYTFERKIENSSREEIYKSTNKEDACKEIVFNDDTTTYDASKYIVIDKDEVTLKDGYYYVYYTVTDAHGNKKSVQYKITIDSNFDWIDNSTSLELKPTVEFNDTFFSSVELGEKIEFSNITASDANDARLETKVYYKYDVAGAEETTLELNDEGKFVIDTSSAPTGATKVTIYAKAINDGGKETVIEEEIDLKSPNYGTVKPTIIDVVEETGYSYTYQQGARIVIPKVIFADETTTDGTGVDALNASVSVKCTDAQGVVTNYTAQDIWSIKIGDALYVSNAQFTAATAGTYQVAVKVVDAAGNVLVKFFEYTVTDAAYTGSLRFANLGITDTTLELDGAYKLTQAQIVGTNADKYDYYVTCKTAAGDYELNKSEFKPKAIGEYKLQYVMYEKANINNIVSEETFDFTITVKDTKGPKINVNWETELLNDTAEKQTILPAYAKGTKILVPTFSASDTSGIDAEKSTIVISSSKTTRTIKMSDMLAEYKNGLNSKSGLMYYTFANDAEYTITYTAYDKQGNSNSVTKTIKIGDLVAPTLVVSDKIAETTYSVGDTITIDLADTKNYITVADSKTTDLEKSDVKVTLFVNGTEVKKNTASTSTKYIFDLTEAGEYELKFSVTDDAGLTTTEVKTFTITSQARDGMSSTEVVGTVLIVVSVVVLAGVVVYFIVSKRKMDKLYK